MKTTVEITNTYADRQNTTTVELDGPASLSADDLEEWWEEVVFCETGDGLGGYACYTAKVMSGGGIPTLIGQEREWNG